VSRRRLLGAVTALVGFEIVTLLTAIRAAATDSASTSVLWLVFGLGFSATVALVGAFCGLAGGTVAHPTSILRSMRRYQDDSPGGT
jgi:cell division protein FtsX